MIFDSLGFMSVMYYFPELIMCLTALEALFLLLAFVDKINLLDIQKKELNEKLLEEMSHRQSLIENRVKEKTIQLQTVVEEKTTLLRELHHRVKNNLQLILSIIRLQGFGIEDKYLLEQFKKLEYRIKAVAKTHEMLCASGDISRVDMHEYITQLCEEMQSGFLRDNIKIRYDMGLNLPLCKAVYIGLIVNELISNSIKHAFAKKGGEIIISLKQLDDNYVLKISDNGDGYKDSMTAKETLGLKLVDSLVSNQLDGKIELNTGNMFEHIVTFPKKVCK
jgi:two-component sensor histidine kinase